MIIGILTIVNAFFASAEMAMVSINKNRIKVLADEGDTKAILLVKLLDEPSKLLATIQVGITLAGFFSSAFAATNLSTQLGAALTKANIPYGNQIALVLITIALSFVMLLFGELFPKRLALGMAEPIAMFSVKPIYYISRFARPFVKLLSASTNTLLRLVGVDHKDLDQKISEEEIRSMVKVGQEVGVFNQTERQMINSIFEFDDKLVKEVMTPRVDMLMVHIGRDISEVLKDLVQLKYSRIPLYKQDKDSIVGILHIKSLLVEALEKGFDGVQLEALTKEPYYVAETMPIDRLFIKLQKDQRHMALVIDEHGLMTGLVTMEDLIEEVMGNIEDEFDRKEDAVKPLGDGTYKVSGHLAIFEFNKIFHTKLQCEDADTIGGFVIKALEHIPENGEHINISNNGFSLTIEEADQRRVRRIVVKKLSSKSTNK